jgi:putative drug exporter of the RND superfamily
MERWTRFVLRHRRTVVVAWVVVLLLGGLATVKIAPLLSNTFSVPGTDSERARHIVERHFGQRPDGTFTLVFRVQRVTPQALAKAQRALVAAAADVKTGRPGTAAAAGNVIFGDVTSELNVAQAKKPTDRLLRVARTVGPPGEAYVTGAGPIQHDLDPIFSQDLRKGESIALPIALLVVLGVFGISVAVTMPFIFAACTITGATGIMYGVAHLAAAPTYVTNLIQLIGLGIAIDYSLLVVYRFREELAVGLDKETAVIRTMETAGRAVIFSGATVAIGLLLLIAMPLPFMRMMGIAGFLIPIVSIAAAATLQPVLLYSYGRRGTARKRILPGEPIDPEKGFWARLSRSIMRRPLAHLALGAALLVAAAVPALWLATTPGSSFGIPRQPQAIAGFDVLRHAVGAGAVAPTQVVIDAGVAGGAASPGVQEAVGRLRSELRADREVAGVRPGVLLDPTRRYALLTSFGRHDYGQPQEQSFTRRLRSKLVPAARFPDRVLVLAGGAPPQGVDFLHQAYTLFPWLILGVLVLTYLLLLRAFRSVLLPLKAVLLNLLSVGASYGMLVVVFRWGVGHDVLGLYQFGQVEGWIPIFLFAMLFGLSMDYEVFLVTRMRESWDGGADNPTAVAHGLERTGRIITAAAVIMVAAFSGFVAGRIVGLQEFGLGLAVAIFVDATIVRSLLVPSLMAVFGRWNWWLPRPVARLVRVESSPLERGAKIGEQLA